jgi:hypothetical protein
LHHQGHYCDVSLPLLPFADVVFGLALCAHLFYLYSAQLPAVFHRRRLQALACRWHTNFNTAATERLRAKGIDNPQ